MENIIEFKRKKSVDYKNEEIIIRDKETQYMYAIQYLCGDGVEINNKEGLSRLKKRRKMDHI